MQVVFKNTLGKTYPCSCPKVQPLPFLVCSQMRYFSYSLLNRNLVSWVCKVFSLYCPEVPAVATAKYSLKEVVIWCCEAAVAAFLVALGQIALGLPCSRSWFWVTAGV